MRALVLSVLIALPAAPAARADMPQAHLQLTYQTYAAGVRVAAMQADLQLGPAQYRINVAFHTEGVLDLLLTSRSESTATGRFAPAFDPTSYRSESTTRGTHRQTEIDYRAGHPVAAILTPPREAPREAIPPDQQAASLDALSAVSLVLNQVTRTGRCDNRQTIFDGRRLLAMTSTTAGQDMLDSTSRSPWSGPALRCNVTSQQTAGFLRDANRQQAGRVHHASVWLKPAMGGGPMVPVRMEIENAWVGVARIYLVAAHAGAE